MLQRNSPRHLNANKTVKGDLINIMLCASNLKANKLNCRGGEVKEFYNGGAFELYLHVGLQGNNSKGH